MLNIGGQPYTCADCRFQHLDWERMASHIKKKHNRESYCGPDAAITPENIEVGRVLIINNTGEAYRVTKITDRARLKVEMVLVDAPLLLQFDEDKQMWESAACT